MKMEQTECSEMLAFKLQRWVNPQKKAYDKDLYISAPCCGVYVSLIVIYSSICEAYYLTLLMPRADISAFAPRAKSATSRYIGSSVENN
jgi:hypothetical protein